MKNPKNNERGRNTDSGIAAPFIMGGLMFYGV